jgi:hypothetical protein
MLRVIPEKMCFCGMKQQEFLSNVQNEFAVEREVFFLSPTMMATMMDK